MRKSIFKRMVTLLMAVMTMAIVFSFSAVSVSAAAVEPVAAVAMVDVADDNTDTVTMQAANLIARKIMPLTGAAGGAGSAGGSGVSNTQADTTYKSVIDFFVKWITRIGWLVAFVGAIMFALAIKNNDAEQKQNGLMTMIAGFVAAAVCMAADMFNLFS